MTENQSEATNFSSVTPNSPVEFLDIDSMEPLMQSNYNPEGVGKMDNTTTDPGNTAKIADTVEVATANSPPSNCITQLEIQVKQLSLALAAASAASSSNKEAACNLNQNGC